MVLRIARMVSQLNSLTLICIFLLTSVVSAFPPVRGVQENSWFPLAAIPTARFELGAAVVNGKIYAIGGCAGVNKTTGNYTYLRVNEEYNPDTKQWTTKADMPTPRSDFGLAVHQNKIYVFGGKSGSESVTGKTVFLKTTEVYDPATDTWERRSNMSTACIPSANAANGEIIVTSGLLNVNMAYDPAADSWTTKKPMPNRVDSSASAIYDGKIFFFGGSPLMGGISTNLVQIYDPDTNTWKSGQPMPTPVTDACAGSTTGLIATERIYVFGGRVENFGLDLTQVYFPQNDSWRIGQSMPTPRFSLSVAAIDDTLYAIGGIPKVPNLLPHVNTEMEQYTPFGYGTIPELSFCALVLSFIIITVLIFFIKKDFKALNKKMVFNFCLGH